MVLLTESRDDRWFDLMLGRAKIAERALVQTAGRVVDTAGLVLVVLTLAVAMFVMTSPFSPIIEIPVRGSPDWASWFDIYVAFPVLSLFVALMIRGTSRLEELIIGGFAILPAVYHSFVSYYWSDAASTYSIWTWIGQFIAGIGISVALVVMVYFAARLPWKGGIGGAVRRKTHYSGVAASLLLVAIGLVIRPITSAGVPNESVSDIGIAVAWSGRDLAAGINPMTTGLPPWGVPLVPPYGPLIPVVAMPFSFLPIDAAAHLESFAFCALSAWMLWKTLERLDSDYAPILTSLFLTSPLTMWAIESAITTHLMITFLILAFLHLHLAKRYVLSGLALSAATLTLFFPALLLIPVLVLGGKERIRLTMSFSLPTAIALMASLVWIPHGSNNLGLSTIPRSGLNFLVYDSILGPFGGIILVLGLLLCLVLLFKRMSSPPLPMQSKFLLSAAIILLMIPVLIGFNFAGFYIWSIPVALLAIASLPQLRSQVRGAGPSGE